GGPSVTGLVNVNRVAEASYGIYAEKAENLLVELNTVGTKVSGQETGLPGQVGVFLLSLGVTDPPVVQGNGIANAAVGIEQRFTGSEIRANTIKGVNQGILTKVSGGEGSLI